MLYKDKARNWFITINIGAECFGSCLKDVKLLNYSHFAFIRHINEVSTETEKEEPEHKHIVLELVNATTFKSIKEHFKGAHIEAINAKKECYRYLLHASAKSNGVKKPYTLEDIVTDSMTYYKSMIAYDPQRYDTFEDALICRYIAEGIRSPFAFLKRFGIDTLKKYWSTYELILKEYRAVEGDRELKAEVEAIEIEIALKE